MVYSLDITAEVGITAAGAAVPPWAGRPPPLGDQGAFGAREGWRREERMRAGAIESWVRAALVRLRWVWRLSRRMDQCSTIG